jgi:hypothetical protein
MLKGTNHSIEANLDLRHLHGEEAVSTTNAASGLYEPLKKKAKDQ